MFTIAVLVIAYSAVTLSESHESNGLLNDLSGSSDATGCTALFGHDYRQCPYSTKTNLKCIRTLDICNGVIDCPDASDENPFICRFKSVSKSGRVRRGRKLGAVDIATDELELDEVCPEIFGQKQSTCPGQPIDEFIKCIRWTDLCDGKVDCPGGLDEIPSNCVPEEEF
ncbi:unnamed protein product [Cylicocyclus nassatus]|uniref:Uncharacterized protein n=1 Tax=Cylicocyclus nassatus TaxID=53992 RepID=A0AA36HFX8_CYLNA|nr:unnamed protein product [Cylicocyclus nassatus]